MALSRHYSDQVTELSPVISSAAGGKVKVKRTFTGPYGVLRTLAETFWVAAESTELSPTTAGEGQLTVTSAGVEGQEPPPDVVELTWQELRLPVTEHPAFNAITPQRKKEIRKAAEEEGTFTPGNEAEGYLYNLLAAGTTEYAVGAPVVRRTRTLRTEPGGGGAWTRENPPALAPEGYEWLKTANETRQEGDTYTHTEEWTGAERWDPVLYPGS
jgi:hypothetical protein